MAYTHTEFGVLKTQLAARLHDSASTYWLDAELGALLAESMRTWQSLTNYWRDRAVFATTSGTSFYNLQSLCSSLLAYTLTDQDLVTDIEYHLMEPATPTVWTGTEQFTLSDITNALQRARNQFLVETGCSTTRTTMVAPSTPISRVQLPDTTIDVRRVAWISVDGVYYHLWREDEFGMTAYASTWATTPTIPSNYSVITTPPVSLQLSPVPLDAGTLELFTVGAPSNLNPVTGVLLNIPDNFAWIVKWGTLAELLMKDGPAMDPSRADYCAKRYTQALDLVRGATCIVGAEIQGVPVFCTSVEEMDAYSVNWQNNSGQPTDICIQSLNYIGLSPVPDAVYSVTLDVVKNAPVPANDAGQVQVGREELEAILGYAEHLAMFKVAGPEWQSTSQFWENMLRLGANYNARLAAASRNMVAMFGSSGRENDMRPRRLGE